MGDWEGRERVRTPLGLCGLSGEDLEKGRARGKTGNAVERCVEGQCCRGGSEDGEQVRMPNVRAGGLRRKLRWVVGRAKGLQRGLWGLRRWS